MIIYAGAGVEVCIVKKKSCDTYIARIIRGNAISLGHPHGTTPGADPHEVAIRVKFDSDGNYFGVRIWGGRIISVAADNSGNIFTCGYFYDPADLDPGPGIDEHISNGFLDIFLSKLDSDGNFLWGRTWGGSLNDEPLEVAVDNSGSASVTGFFRGPVDFDPGPGIDEHFTQGADGSFLSKFDADGNYIWARTWGGNQYSHDTSANSVAADDASNVYVAGHFQYTTDFDPGPGVDERTVNGPSFQWDAYLCKYDSGGNYIWTLTWGGIEADKALSVVTDDSGEIYVAGYFMNTADLDPGPGIEEHEATDYFDSFMINFLPDGSW